MFEEDFLNEGIVAAMREMIQSVSNGDKPKLELTVYVQNKDKHHTGIPFVSRFSNGVATQKSILITVAAS